MASFRTRLASGSLSAPSWLGALCAAFAPTAIGYQDLAALFTRQPAVSERWRESSIALPFETIHVAAFSFSRPLGTAVPGYLDAQPVNFDPHSPGAKIWPIAEPPDAYPSRRIEYPTVNRQHKGDRLAPPQTSPALNEPKNLPQLIDAPAPPPAAPAPPGPKSRQKNAGESSAAPPAARPHMSINQPRGETAAPIAQSHSEVGDVDAGARRRESDDDAGVADQPPEVSATGEPDPGEPMPSSPFAQLSFVDEGPAERNAQLYFGVAAMGYASGLEQWAPGAAPVLTAPSVGSDIKLSVLGETESSGASGEGAVDKNAVRLESPAVRLGLTGKVRAKAEKCLADAVYFEARGEPLRGQMAVAQVVMNRVFSGYYPHDVCGVVYQNANRHLACQFTFACDGVPDRVNEPEMWAQAKRIAKNTLEGKIWLAEVGHATHYHAYWVHPSWVHEMKKMYKLGVHTFYRPRAWGDGSDAPAWGNVPVEQAAAKVPEAAAEPVEAAAVKRRLAAGRDGPA